MQHLAFQISYTKLPHVKLKSKLSFDVDFPFKGGAKTFCRLSNNRAAYRGEQDLTLVKHHLKQLFQSLKYDTETANWDPMFGQIFFYIPIKKNTYHH